MVMLSSVASLLLAGSASDNEQETENKREWGVERHDDVIYDIMLKRVQHGNSPQNEVSEGLQWGTHKVRYVKAATLERLVAHLCRWKRIKREEAEDKRLPLFRSIERLIRTWVKRHFNDFYQPPSHPLLHQLVRDVEGWRADTCDVIEADDDLTSFLRTKLNAAELQTFQEKCLEDMNSPGNYVEQDDPGSPLGEVPDNTEATKTFLNDLSPTHVAEQLTLKDANLFMRTIPHHCLDA
uniref:Uncharacterized protein n=1 Tax=Ciona savignyi TaxID=51511 RepID=H2YKA4_CIOSA